LLESARIVRSPRITYLVTHPATASRLLDGQLGQLRSWGFDVSVISAPGADLDLVHDREHVSIRAVAMERPIALRADVGSLARIHGAVRELRPDIVNASTPKAGLLGMLAARVIDVPVRIYLLRGLRLETTRGALRRVLGATERAASRCAHEIVSVSPSLRDAYVRGGWAPAHKVRVLGDGSSNGVDTRWFAPTLDVRDAARRVRAHYSIPDGAPVIAFLGRLSRDKGIGELLDTFAQIRRRHPSTRLLLVSADLSGEDIAPEARAIAGIPNVVVVPRVPDVRPYLAAANVLGFPSHREGFPNIVLEAAALEVPAVGYRVTGVVDAIVDDVTGTLVAEGDVGALTAAIDAYLEDAHLRRRHGEAARGRAVARFARPIVWRRWAEAYDAWLARRGLPRPAGL